MSYKSQIIKNNQNLTKYCVGVEKSILNADSRKSNADTRRLFRRDNLRKSALDSRLFALRYLFRQYHCNKIKKIFSIFLVTSFVLSSFLFSINTAYSLEDYYSKKEIVVIIGEVKPLSVSNPRQVKIGNPSLLDVVGAGKKELLLSGSAEGETTLSIVDDYGQHSYNVKIFNEDLEKLKERVDFLLEASGLSGLTTRIGDKERKVFILGKLSVAKKDFFESKIASMQDKIVNLVEYQEDTPSIEVDVEVLEIEKTAIDQLGFNWASKSYTLSNIQFSDFLDPSQTLKILKSPWDQSTWQVTLNFLKQKNKARTLSRPKMVCLSGKEAKLLIGGEVPIIVSTVSSTTNIGPVTNVSVELKEVGITLSIKPLVQDDEQIHVNLQTVLREIDKTTSLTLSGGVTTPGFTTRTAQTELTVMNGQTMFLAGLIKSKRTDNRDSIQGLGSIPFFGALFRNKDQSLKDTELVITLTPTIIKTSSQSEISSAAATEQKVNFSANSLESASSRSLTKEKDRVLDYSTLIQNIINSNLKYPVELKDKKIEGTVKLSLHLEANGKLMGVVVMRSSGNNLLDETAQHTVKRLSPFPAFPSEVKLKELWIDIPIVYEIGGSA